MLIVMMRQLFWILEEVLPALTSLKNEFWWLLTVIQCQLHDLMSPVT